MDLDKIWSIFLLIFGFVAALVKSFPMDFDSIKDGIQMGAMTGAGMAMDLAEKANIQGSFDEKISMGPIQIEKKFDAGGGIMANHDDSSEEDRKRKRRSTTFKESEPTPLNRSKRSPCFGKRRTQQASTTAAPGGGGAGAGGAGAGGAGTGGAGANAGGGAGGSEIDDLRRRRKRSPDYEEDVNENIIPFHKGFTERTQEIGERIRELMKSMLDVLTKTFENLKSNFENMASNSSNIQ